MNLVDWARPCWIYLPLNALAVDSPRRIMRPRRRRSSIRPHKRTAAPGLSARMPAAMEERSYVKGRRGAQATDPTTTGCYSGLAGRLQPITTPAAPPCVLLPPLVEPLFAAKWSSGGLISGPYSTPSMPSRHPHGALPPCRLGRSPSSSSSTLDRSGLPSPPPPAGALACGTRRACLSTA